jgi:hypothetical protein
MLGALVSVKYQIFVSSTFDDLREERNRVMQGILEMGHIPVGMEMFSAANEEQWNIIAKHIDESDYYVLIIAHRYGSTIDGISYTEKEYDYALSKGVPVIGFILDATASWPGDRMDSDPTQVASLAAFKERVRGKPVGFWESGDDLYGKSSNALWKTFANNPRTGWMRASNAVGPEVTAEISRLSAESAVLREKLAAYETQHEEEARFQKDYATLKRNSRTSRVKYFGTSSWEDGKELALTDIFGYIAAGLVPEGSIESIVNVLAVTSATDTTRTPQSYPINFATTILTDFMAFDLVAPSDRPHSALDSNQYWMLTERGIAFLNWRRRAMLESGDTPRPIAPGNSSSPVLSSAEDEAPE